MEHTYVTLYYYTSKNKVYIKCNIHYIKIKDINYVG